MDLPSTNILSPGPDEQQDNILQPAVPMPTPATRPLPAAAAATPEMREFGDVGMTRKAIYDEAFRAFTELEPVSNQTHTLAVRDVQWADPETYSKRDRKQAILTGHTMGRRIRGTWELIDNLSGKVVDRRKQVLARVPYLTEGGTFVHNGSEYSLKNQQRLRPGIFTRVKENGEIEAHVNVLSGGPSHRYFLDPEKGVFYIRAGQAQIPLLPLLQELGADRNEVRKAWGDELYATNFNKADASSLQKLRERFANKEGQTLKSVFEQMTMDPEVTSRTLGKPFDRLNKEAILAATSKLLAVSRKEAEVDDRDHLAFQVFYGPEDLLAERLRRDRAGVRRQLLFKAVGRGNLASMPSSALQKQVDSAILESGLGQAIEEINPAEIFDKQTQISRLGEGGIPSIDAIPDEARSVQPSHMGFMDPLRTPESSRAGVDVHMARNSRKGRDGKIYAQFKDSRTGKLVWKTPQEASDLVVGFPGAMKSTGKRVPAMMNGRITYVPKSRVNLELPFFEDAFSPLGNLVPMKSMVKGQRVAMASRMLTQALPLMQPEAPLVRGAIPGSGGTSSFEGEYGTKMGAIKADRPGKVVAVSDENMTVRYDDGKTEEIELYHNMPFNRKTFVHQRSVVQPGQPFQAGQVIAKSNFTDDEGVTALGLNARVAYVPWGGRNFEDAVVISESMAKRLSSEHMYQHELEMNDKVRLGRRSFIGLFPGKYDKEMLSKFDDTGLIKPGTEVNFGDPLILAAEEKPPTANKVHKKGKSAFGDASITWKHHNSGIVTDVVTGRNGPVVVVKSSHPMTIGDKMSGRYGDKGVVSAIIPDNQMPHNGQGKPFEVLLNPLGVISRTNPAQMVEAALGKLARHRGKAVNVEDFSDIEDMTDWARQQLAAAGLQDTEDIIDPASDRKIKGIKTGERFFMKLHHMAESKGQGRSSGAYAADGSPAKGGEYGCFTAKQKIVTSLGPMKIAQICEKRIGAQVRTFSEKLNDWVYRPVTDWFVYRAKVSDLITIHTQGGPCEKESSHTKVRSCLYATKNHIVKMYDGHDKAAGDVVPGDRLVTWGPVATEHQWEFLYGTMLGDASADNASVSFEHSVKQAAYVDWKRSVLSGLCPSQCDAEHDHTGKPTFVTDRVRSRVVWLPLDYVARDIRRVCYNENGVKTVTAEWLSRLTDFSVAVWVLDDGSITNRAKKKGRVNFSGNIATHGFDANSLQLLLHWFNQKYNTSCTINCVGAISLTADACRKLIDVIAAWVPARAIPKSKRFLRSVVATKQSSQSVNHIESVCRLGKVPLFVSDVTPYVHDKPGVLEINVYDFTVAETHTYVAGHALVSNSKRMALLDVNALLSHGATEVIRDASSIRGQKNEDYWLQFMSGFTPREPKVPMVYQKFVDELKAAGINAVRKGSQTQIMALTDRDVTQLAGDREIRSGETVHWERGLEPIEGGLFDKKLTGGHHGNRWSYVKLNDPMPNPVMEEPIRRVLGLTKKEFEGVIAGTETLPGFGSGSSAMVKALSAMDLDRELLLTRAKIQHGNKTERDNAIRKLGYLRTAKRLDIHPRQWIMTKVPVLPPQFRPVSTMSGKGTQLVSDPNYLYKDLIEVNNNLGGMKKELGDDGVGDERLAVYHAFKAVTGLGDPITQQSQDKDIRGILKGIFGSSPKFGTVQRKLLSTTVDNVGRAVIAPNPDLDMDSVGLPEDRAFDVYQRFVVRRLKRRGMPLTVALQHVKDKSSLARQMLIEEMENRPVIINRAPVLHRYGILAFRPQLVKGSTLQVSPLVVKGFNADFDGDAMNYHVPTSEEARREAYERMLPSRQLLSPADFKTPVYAPGQEYVGGLYHASTSKRDGPGRVFATTRDAMQAWLRGDISVDEKVKILQK